MWKSLKVEYEAQAASLKELQAQRKMIGESQRANMQWLQAQTEESAKRARECSFSSRRGGSDDYLQQQRLERSVQVEVQPSSSGDI